jgi:hypothetical protein
MRNAAIPMMATPPITPPTIAPTGLELQLEVGGIVEVLSVVGDIMMLIEEVVTE